LLNWENTMKKFAFAAIAMCLGTVGASAADMAVKARPAPLPVALYDWSGCYIGGHVGGTWGRANVNIPNYPANFNNDESSVSGGALAGCQFMTQSRFVFGIEGDYTWMDLDGEGLTGALAGTERFHTHFDQSASVRGRIGYSPLSMPNVLFYGTGGWAAANLSQANYIPLAPALNAFRSGWTNGWVAGVSS
jgi:outer membrane immunogenic protein